MNDTTQKQDAWLQPNQQKKPLLAGLYVVATPIGNLRDISIRALDTLAAADIVLCEDTRMTGKLLRHYGLSKSMRAYHDHSKLAERARVMDDINHGKIVALCSDAGTPLISDPGYKLVRECLDNHLYVTAIPGASAVLTGLQLSGLPSDIFTFIGFLPTKTKARQDVLSQWHTTQTTLIAYETAPRLVKALTDIDAIMGARSIAVTRELTKLHEETRQGTAAELIEYYNDNGLPKGEIVLVIAPPEEQEMSDDDVIKALKNALKTMSVKHAATHVAQSSGWQKSKLYDLAVSLKDQPS